MKKVVKSDVIGQHGMSLIEGIVLLEFMFYPTGGVEAEIDGFIELRDAETGEVATGSVQYLSHIDQATTPVSESCC
ncbi:hypothetical protein [Bradyrhizobium sp. CCBAU 53338]|uniref:hypothetical protein n=1 Tax=Bradyrhizobium sp. CCBAU 53338 TaxID=1325111 RepID=UPI00188BC8D5|nr:hypothetical protein [Bradyrhizobium sp. CCBAU 53338]